MLVPDEEYVEKEDAVAPSSAQDSTALASGGMELEADRERTGSGT